MNNAEKFKRVFGKYATELWSMPESDFLAWLNRTAESAQNTSSCTYENDVISRQAALRGFAKHSDGWCYINALPSAQPDLAQLLAYECGKASAQPERKWTPCSNPPKHHKDVIVRGIEAIGNVTVHKVMQWDVDTWRPTDYAPSIMWKEWSEI